MEPLQGLVPPPPRLRQRPHQQPAEDHARGAAAARGLPRARLLAHLLAAQHLQRRRGARVDDAGARAERSRINRQRGRALRHAQRHVHAGLARDADEARGHGRARAHPQDARRALRRGAARLVRPPPRAAPVHQDVDRRREAARRERARGRGPRGLPADAPGLARPLRERQGGRRRLVRLRLRGPAQGRVLGHDLGLRPLPLPAHPRPRAEDAHAARGPEPAAGAPRARRAEGRRGRLRRPRLLQVPARGRRRRRPGRRGAAQAHARRHGREEGLRRGARRRHPEL